MSTTDTKTQPSTYIERDAWLRAVLASDLPHVAVRVALAIGFHLNVEFGRCYPGIKDIVTASNIPERSIYRQIALLEKAGWLAVRHVRRPGQHNEYVLARPATAMAGLHPERPATGDRVDLPIGGRTEQAKIQEADAKASASRGRERCELALAVIPASALAEGGALEGKEGVDRFPDLWQLWSSARSWPDSDFDEAVARRSFDLACREADPDDIIAAARAWVSAVEPRCLSTLSKWLLGRGFQKRLPARRQRNGNKVSLSSLALEIGGRS
jgi:hypothetical protein